MSEEDKARICHRCGRKMQKKVGGVPFNVHGHVRIIPNVTYYQCGKCNEMVFGAEEAKRIDAVLHKVKGKKQ